MLEIKLPRSFILRTNLEERLKEKLTRKPSKKKGKREKRRESRPRCKNFRNTPLGRFLYNNCPIEWKLITGSINMEHFWRKTDFIESVCQSSENPIFKSVAFRRVLADFRKYGMYTPNRKDYTVTDELEGIRNRLKIK